MRRGSRTERRKAPRQRRSTDTVEAILTAAARLFGNEGLATTTNRIAAVAGVSVGSLYQYFPSKEALVAALLERHVSNVLRELPKIGEIPVLPFPVAARAAVEAILRAHARDPALLRTLHAEQSRAGRLALVRDRESRLTASVRALLDAFSEQLRVGDPDVTAFVLVHLVEGLAHAAVVHRPALLRSPRFRDAIVDAVLGCVGFQGPEPATTRPGR